MPDQQNKDVVATERDSKGRFVIGNKAGKGRPEGSKNRITVLKLMAEEAFREEAYADVMEVLLMVVQQAKEGDKVSQKLVWDSAVSKGVMAQDKDAKGKTGFTVHHMHHDVIDNNEEEENGE